MLEIAHPQLRQLYEYWQTRVATTGRAVLLRRDIDPIELRFCLGFLLLSEIEEPFRVRYRLVGTRLVEIYGRELTGCYVDELYPAFFQRRTLRAYRKAVERREPVYDEQVLTIASVTLGYHRLVLPLSSKGDRVDLALVGVYPANARMRRASDWRPLTETEQWQVAIAALDDRQD